MLNLATLHLGKRPPGPILFDTARLGASPPAKDRRATMPRDTILKPANAIGFALLALSVFTVGGAYDSKVFAQAAPPAQTRAPSQMAPQAQAPLQNPATPQQPQGLQPAQPQSPPAAQPQGQGLRSAAPSQPAGASAGRGTAQQASRPRRRSYAACNRISHTRGLRGGARRRFLVRCKLGYDRPRNGQSQPNRQP
ncbi:hypothetical protein ASF60_03850 [Methylobacterium sp. Leaf113]|nr:hypothetical protein ASF60_03850 [Methylobacterium sp. Leaf113]